MLTRKTHGLENKQMICILEKPEEYTIINAEMIYERM